MKVCIFRRFAWLMGHVHKKIKRGLCTKQTAELRSGTGYLLESSQAFSHDSFGNHVLLNFFLFLFLVDFAIFDKIVYIMLFSSDWVVEG